MLSANQNDVILSYITKYHINVAENNTEHESITHSLEQLPGIASLVELKHIKKKKCSDIRFISMFLAYASVYTASFYHSETDLTSSIATVNHHDQHQIVTLSPSL